MMRVGLGDAEALFVKSVSSLKHAGFETWVCLVPSF